MGHFGFSYIGLLFLLMLVVPNIVWARTTSRAKIPGSESKILLLFERIGEVLTTACLLMFDDFNLHGWSNWTWWLIAAFAAMVMYDCWWIRYFRTEGSSADLYRGFLGIPLAGATLPVISFFLLGIYGKVVWLAGAAAIFGIGHIGIHLQHKIENDSL